MINQFIYRQKRTRKSMLRSTLSWMKAVWIRSGVFIDAHDSIAHPVIFWGGFLYVPYIQRRATKIFTILMDKILICSNITHNRRIQTSAEQSTHSQKHKCSASDSFEHEHWLMCICVRRVCVCINERWIQWTPNIHTFKWATIHRVN